MPTRKAHARTATRIEKKNASVVTQGMGMQLTSLLQRSELERYEKSKDIEMCKSWVYIAARLNAQVISGQALRLFSKRPSADDDDMPKIAPYRRITTKQASIVKVMAGMPDAEEGAIVEITEHPFLDLMQRVNPFRNGNDHMQETIMSKYVCGNSYWLVSQGTEALTVGIPQELWLLAAERMTIVPDEKNFIKGYLYGTGQKRVALTTDQVIHFREPNLRDPFYGMSRIEAAWGAIAGYEAIEVYERGRAKNPIPEMVAVMKDASLTARQRREYQREFDILLSEQSSRRSALLGVEDMNVEFKPLGIAPREMAMLGGRAWRREEIVNAFGQSVALYTDTPSRANVEGALYRWGKFELDPCAVQMAQKITEKLLPMYDGGDSLFCAFDPIAVADREFDLRQETADVQSHIRSINEIRTARGLEPLEDERADDPFYVPSPVAMPDPFALDETPPDNSPLLRSLNSRRRGLSQRPSGAFDGERVHPTLKGVPVYP